MISDHIDPTGNMVAIRYIFTTLATAAAGVTAGYRLDDKYGFDKVGEVVTIGALTIGISCIFAAKRYHNPRLAWVGTFTLLHGALFTLSLIPGCIMSSVSGSTIIYM